MITNEFESLDFYNIKGLREKAKLLKVNGYYKMSRAELIEAIKDIPYQCEVEVVNSKMLVNGKDFEMKEYNGQRVVTFKDIDKVHERPDGTAKRNFNYNKKYFIEGVDFFVRNSYEAKKEFNIIAPNGLMLFTESGYYMLVKSFNDELSWTVQRELVNNYFRVSEKGIKAIQEICDLSLKKSSQALNKLSENYSMIDKNISMTKCLFRKIKEMETEIENLCGKIDKMNKTNRYINKSSDVNFTPPTLEKVKEYCNEINIKINAEDFVDYYSSVGWLIGEKPMRDWKASVRYWANRNK